jgi:hypothetical protein
VGDVLVNAENTVAYELIWIGNENAV